MNVNDTEDTGQRKLREQAGVAVGAAEAGSEPNHQLSISATLHSEAALLADFTDLEAQLQSVLIDYPSVPLFPCGDLNCDLLKEPSFRESQHLISFPSS